MRFAVQLERPEESDRLKFTRLGVTAEQMSQVGLRMLDARASAHPYGATTSPGFRCYDQGLAALGDALVPLGWTRERSEGLEVVMRPDRALAISVNSMAEGMEEPADTVVARFQRGRSVRRRVHANAAQLGLFTETLVSIESDQVESAPPFTLWILGHTYSEHVLTVRLILPADLEDDQRTFRLTDSIKVGRFGFGEQDTSFEFGPSGDSPLPPPPTITIEPR